MNDVFFENTAVQIRHRRLRDRREHRGKSPPISGWPRGRHQAPPEVQIRENRKRSSYDMSALRARVRAARRTGREALNGKGAVDPRR